MQRGKNKMKIYAKQVMPEYQESPLFMDEWPENVYIFGNRHFRDHGGDHIENIKNSMYDAADELKALLRGRSYYASFIDIIHDFLPAPENKKEYSRADRLKWRALLLNFDAGAITDDDATTAALELITGDEYDAAQITGCCQGDWNNIVYPAKYGREWLENFEIEYFNTGDEWRISESTPDGDDEYYFYTHAWNDDGKRAEIAAAAGVDPADVVLYVFDGYAKAVVYRTVTA
jgi:hypothetical protein